MGVKPTAHGNKAPDNPASPPVAARSGDPFGESYDIRRHRKLHSLQIHGLRQRLPR